MVVLEIKGMSCQHCIRSVTEALAAVPGVTQVVAVDLDQGRALVEGDVAADKLVAAVKEAGYGAAVGVS
jgi:copper chaperone CopZ